MKRNINDKGFWHNFFNSPWLLLLLVIFVTIVIYSVLEVRKDYAQNKGEILGLENEVLQYQEDNIELSDMIEYLRSEDYVEKEARENLNMQSEGEKVIIVAKANNNENNAEGGETNKGNLGVWLEYFFGEK